MGKVKFTVQPQRSDGSGYVPCELHRATSFALIREEAFTREGRAFKVCRVAGRYQTRNQAESAAEANRQSHEPLARNLVRRLGKRIVT